MATNRKKTFPKKPIQRFAGRKATRIVMAVIGAVVLVVQIGLDVHFWHTAAASTSEPITSMIIEAVTAFHKPAVIEPVSKKVYLPDANLVLPPQPQNMPNLLYAYNPSAGSSSAEVDVTVTSALSMSISRLRNAQGQGMMNRNNQQVFDAVPNLQVCSRGVHIVFTDKTTYAHLQFVKQLADGRTMYAYTEKQSCAYNLDALANYLRSAESY